jgi:hypothetical protein
MSANSLSVTKDFFEVGIGGQRGRCRGLSSETDPPQWASPSRASGGNGASPFPPEPLTESA